MSVPTHVRGHVKVPTDGQLDVPIGGQVKVSTSLRVVSGELVAWAVTVIAPTSHLTGQGVPLKSARERMNIISTYREVGTYRGAAELCGTTHKTVKRAVERAEAGGPPAREPRPRNFDAVRDVVAERVAKSRGRISAKRLLPIAKAAGYEGSARNFRRLVAEQKALWRKDNHRGRRPAVWAAGEYLVIDWAEAAPGLFVFCAVLWSDRTLAETLARTVVARAGHRECRIIYLMSR
jgi:hypothetical protein